MQLKQLRLHNFRNYEHVIASFGPGINLIQGKNGQGKTNLLEAICLLSTGQSFRTTHLKDLIRHGAAGFSIEGIFERDGIEQRLKISFDGQTKRVQHNQTNYTTFAKLLGLLPVVLMAPHDHELIGGAPNGRRRFLNIHIAQSNQTYAQHLIRYHKALQQRNCLLKSGEAASLDVWEAEMALSALYIVAKRQESVKTLRTHLMPLAQELSLNADIFDLTYTPSLATKFIDFWKESRPKELIIGSTLHGPHRDDLQITFREKLAKSFSSEGQKRSCLAALRFAQWLELRDQTETTPLFGIDDFGVHLDPNRMQKLQEKLADFGQVFLTTALDHPWSHVDQILTVVDGSLS